MMNLKLSILTGIALLLAACSPVSDRNDARAGVPALLAEAAQDVSAQHFDNAMENALRALELSAGDPLLKVSGVLGNVPANAEVQLQLLLVCEPDSVVLALEDGLLY